MRGDDPIPGSASQFRRFGTPFFVSGPGFTAARDHRHDEPGAHGESQSTSCSSIAPETRKASGSRSKRKAPALQLC